MYRVFLCEDETIIREGLRDNIPWEKCGFKFVGEAGDGEMALPMIRKERPDVLITDIKMPFMDGLSLSHLVRKELPDIKIIIISGYDDFEYARTAIKEGVSQYLLKPITRSMLQKALVEIRETLEKEEAERRLRSHSMDENRTYEETKKRLFFEKVFEGRTTLPELYEEAEHLKYDIEASSYNLLLLNVEACEGIDGTEDSEVQANEDCREELKMYFLRYSGDCIHFKWTPDTVGILIKGEIEDIEEKSHRFVNDICEICRKYGEMLNYYVAEGIPVNRFSRLAECYGKVNESFSYRFFIPDEHVFRYGMLGGSVVLSKEDGESRSDMKKALTYIGENYFRDDLSLNEVASIMGLSPNYFSAAFGEDMGETFVEYVTRLRMDKAKQLLMDPDIKSGEVGPLVGYKNPQYFSYVFKKTAGMSPREWRRIEKHQN